MLVGSGPVPCLVLASVGASWARATLPSSMHDAVTFHLIEPEGGESSVDAVAEELATAARGLDRPVVAGISMNGTLALAAAAAHPDVFAGVIAVTAPPRLPPDPAAAVAYAQAIEPERQAEFDRRKADAEVAPEGSEAEDRLWRRVDAVRRWHNWNLDTTALDALAQIDPSWVRSVMADGAQRDWPSTIAAVRCPVLLVLGRSDFVMPPPSWPLNAPPANFTVEVFDASGHTPPYEQPEQFDRAVRRWLTRTGRADETGQTS